LWLFMALYQHCFHSSGGIRTNTGSHSYYESFEYE
jgi:hypothetical protein